MDSMAWRAFPASGVLWFWDSGMVVVERGGTLDCCRGQQEVMGVEPRGLWHRQPCQDTQHRHHQAPSNHWYRQHHLRTGPMAPQAPQCCVYSPMAPRDSQAPHVSLLSPWPCSLCPTVHAALVPLSLMPSSPGPLVPMATSPVSPCSPLCAPVLPMVPTPCHPTLRTLSAPNPSAQRKPRDRVGGHLAQCHHRGQWLCPLWLLASRHWRGQVLCPFIVVSTIIFLCPGCCRAESPEGTGTPWLPPTFPSSILIPHPGPH